MPGDTEFVFAAAPENSGQRLDSLIANRIPDLSRSVAAELIRTGFVLVAGTPRKAGYRLKSGETIRVTIPPPVAVDCRPEAIPLDILFEDEDLVALNKPAGLVVHPAPGHAGGTLVNALLHHCRDLQGIGGELRPGIVHRLDKDTSGVMVVAKTQAALFHLADQFKRRRVSKRYLALVAGNPRRDAGILDQPIGRHPIHRKKMTVRDADGRRAVTRWRVLARYTVAALIEACPETGRTHQIRVHLAALGHPVIGDGLYGKGRPGGGNLSAVARSAYHRVLSAIERQQLHAQRLTFFHPRSEKQMVVAVDPPEDMQTTIDRLGRLEGDTTSSKLKGESQNARSL